MFIYMLLLPEGQRGETWEPSKIECYFGNWGAFDRRVFSVLLEGAPRLTGRSFRCTDQLNAKVAE